LARSQNPSEPCFENASAAFERSFSKCSKCDVPFCVSSFGMIDVGHLTAPVPDRLRSETGADLVPGIPADQIV